MKPKLIATALLAGSLCAPLLEGEAQAQVQPIVERDPNWDTVSQITMMVGVASVALTPRIYYASPDATVGWKARWHLSSLVPTLAATSLTLFMNGPVRGAIQSPKEGCTVDATLARPGSASGCATWGGPSTHSFASWTATGAGTAIFLVDTLKYSDGAFSVGSFIGNIGLPFTASILTSVARSADGSGLGPEGTGQVVAGALPGLAVGAVLGLTYAYLQEPDCGYGGYLLCW